MNDETRFASLLAPAETAGGPPGRILVVDDHPVNRELVAEILGEAGYEVVQAVDGEAALEAVAASRPDAILLDIMMPKLDGYEVCRRLRRSRRSCFIPIVMVTALADVVSKVRGLEAGADDFINKPVHRGELLARLRSLIRIRRLRDQLDSTEDIIFTMVTALEGKLPAMRGHSLRVAALARALGERLSLPPSELESLVLGALLHDIGKIGVPERILTRSREQRSSEEEAYYASHPKLGERILGPLASLRDARRIIRHHHERLDGTGYPDRLQGVAFDLPIEIVAAANAFDNYRTAGGAPGADPAATRLRAEAAGGAFHPDVIEELLRVAAELPETPPEVADLLPLPAPRPGGRIVIADDTVATREVYEAVLSSAGYRVTVVGDGEEALAALWRKKPDLLLLDLRMPGLSGDQVCRRLKDEEEFTYLPVLLVSAVDGGDRLRGLECGADEFLFSPIDRQELVARVRSLLRLRSYHQDLERHESVVLSLSTTLEAKDPYTRGHSARVGKLSCLLARELGLRADFCHGLETAGMVHDIGKVAVPEAILNKAGPLTPAEMAVVMSHPVVGWEMCRPLRSLREALPVIRYHHERYDGSGYPEGLHGEEIPLGARILSLADAFDALTSARSYRDLMSQDEAAFMLLRETHEGRWDREVFAALGVLLANGVVREVYQR